MDRTNSSDTDLSSLTPPPASNSSTNDVEGIWSPDIEQSFIEALAIYPPCGRRKIILTEEGKMYGRNELVSRYIKIRTGKVRTRKQVSSHLQVLAKRRAKDLQDLRNDAEAQKRILDRLKQYTSAEIVSMTLDNKDDRNQLIKISKHSSRSKSNDKHSSRIQQTSTTMNRLKIKDESFNSPVRTNQSTTGILLPRAPTMKNSLTKRSTSNTPIPSFLPTSSLPCSSMHSMNQMVNHHSTLILPSASIGHDDFRLQEMCAFIELKRTINSTHPSRMYPYSEGCSIFQHDLLRLHMNDIQMKNLHTFETISIDQIFDKFPHYDGLKDLYEQNPNGSFYLIKFWADVSPPLSIMNSVNNRDESFYTSYTYTSCSNRPIRISTRLCSFGKQVLEKVEISDYPQLDQFHQFIYRFDRSPLCDYMIQFIQKLRSLPNTPMMNSVLENFTILQVIKCRDESDQLLLCLAFVFEIGTSDGSGPQYQVYKLVAN